MTNRMLRNLLYDHVARVCKALAIDRFDFRLIDAPTRPGLVQRKAP